MPCASNINTFVTGTVPYTDSFTHNFAVLDLAKWVSYQSFLSPYYGALPISIILGQWGFEMGWSLSEFAARNNPGNMDFTCGYKGSRIDGVSIPGKRYKFDDLIEGVTAYAHLLIAGYPCVQSAYSHGGIATSAGLTKACNALSAGYDVDNTTSSSYCSSGNTYAENSSSTKRIWATAGYSGLYITINGTNNTCLNVYNYIQSSDPNLYKFTNISF